MPQIPILKTFASKFATLKALQKLARSRRVSAQLYGKSTVLKPHPKTLIQPSLCNQSTMGRRKNGNHSSTSLNGLPQPQGSKICFEDDDEALIEETTESSNLDESMCEADDSNRAIEDSACEPGQSLNDKDEKTSADYYFDSYSHFGNGFSFPPSLLI